MKTVASVILARVCSVTEKNPHQDEDHSGSRPHSFHGLYVVPSGTSPEKFRSGPKIVGSEESHQDKRAALRPTELLRQLFVTISLIS